MCYYANRPLNHIRRYLSRLLADGLLRQRITASHPAVFAMRDCLSSKISTVKMRSMADNFPEEQQQQPGEGVSLMLRCIRMIDTMAPGEACPGQASPV
jgi:hypothetical protein